jgi:hypothetical protein
MAGIVMQWRFFLGAALLTAALIVPNAGTKPVVAGIVLAAIVQWGRSRNRRHEL